MIASKEFADNGVIEERYKAPHIGTEAEIDRNPERTTEVEERMLLPVGHVLSTQPDRRKS